MANYNKVILLGNLTRDIELRYSQSGTAIAKLGLAINRRYTVNGEQKEETCFVDLTAFGKQAETLNQYVGKGSPLFVEGRLEFSTWEDKDGGGKRSKLAVVIENFQFVGAPRERGEGAPARRSGPGPRAAESGGGGNQGGNQGGENVDYGEIPF